MREYRLTESESQFADMIWASEPIHSRDLVALCNQELGWKKSTTYTMLKRLINKEIFQNNESTVTSLIEKEAFHAEQSKLFVAKTFGGSLPRFLASFTRTKRLSKKEIDELQKLIDEHKEG